MCRDTLAGNIVGLAHRLRQFQHADKHRRHPLADRHAVAFDQAQGLFRIEMFHDNGRSADAMHGHAEAQWRRVIQRSR